MSRRRNGEAPTIERKIHFYRTDIGVDGGGRPLPFDPSPALNAITGRPFTDGNEGRYLVGDDGNAVCAWPGASGAFPSLRFCQIRRTGLPQLEQAGRVSDLNIAADAGLLEPIHVAFFRDNIVGADFNFYGPRLSRLGNYLRVKSENAVPMAVFHPLLRNDVAEQLDHLIELRLFNLKVKPAYIETIRQADTSLGEAFAATAAVLDGNSEDIEVILRPSKSTWSEALRRFIPSLKALARRPDLRENAERFQVKGRHDESNRVEIIDLLRDQLIARKQVLRLGERNRAVDAGSAFRAIELAHEELAGELRHAAGVA